MTLPRLITRSQRFSLALRCAPLRSLNMALDPRAVQIHTDGSAYRNPGHVSGRWPALNSEKRLWVDHPCGFCFTQGWGRVPHPMVLRVRVLNLLFLATFYFLISTWPLAWSAQAKKGGACRRRDHPGRGGGRPVPRRSIAAPGTANANTPPPAALLSVNCNPRSKTPNCGRNCGRLALVARHGPGTCGPPGFAVRPQVPKSMPGKRRMICIMESSTHFP